MRLRASQPTIQATGDGLVHAAKEEAGPIPSERAPLKPATPVLASFAKSSAAAQPYSTPGAKSSSPGAKADLSEEIPSRPAYQWHGHRRAVLLRDPRVVALLREGTYRATPELLLTLMVAAIVVTTHVATALLLEWAAAPRQSSSGVAAAALPTSAARNYMLVFAASASVGGQCAFLIQALNHEIAHAIQALTPSVWQSWPLMSPGNGHCSLWTLLRHYASWPRLESMLIRAIGLCLAVGGAALCHVPWAAYYLGGGHQRHHRFAGSSRDVDRDAIFWLWEMHEERGMVIRFFWLSWAAVAVPLAYAVSLLRYVMYNFWGNLKELGMVTTHVLVFYLAGAVVGRHGVCYWILSSWFSMGFLAHPLAAFWILQHKCVGGEQPTVSYYGSRIWNLLCLNELLHVEHHDFSGLGWRYLPRLRELAPDLYEGSGGTPGGPKGGLYAEHSIFGIIHAWLCSASEGVDSSTSDFACRSQWGYSGRSSQMRPRAQPQQSAPRSQTPPLTAHTPPRPHTPPIQKNE